jgi:enoyl-CoA hydratase
MTRSYETLKLDDIDKGILQVAINRPAFSNAINTQVGHDLKDLWNSLTDQPDLYRCIILTGTGQRAFCAGGDLKERAGMTDAAWAAQHLVFERMYQAQIGCPIPIIGAINGAAFGGGVEMALCCDFAYAAEHARFALTEVKLGIMPGGCGTQTLPRIIGEARAKELILTGRTFSAEEALAWGMINKICSKDDLMMEVYATARQIAANAPLSVKQAKHSIHYGLQMDLNTALRFEIEAYNRLIPTSDRHEGVTAFNEKRAPRFIGR